MPFLRLGIILVVVLEFHFNIFQLDEFRAPYSAFWHIAAFMRFVCSIDGG